MQTYYVSLVGPLLGYYIPVRAKDKKHLGLMLNCSRFRYLWCAGYSKEDFKRHCREYGGKLLQPFHSSNGLTFGEQQLVEDWHLFEKGMAEIYENTNS